jgi:hypothetical protein
MAQRLRPMGSILLPRAKILLPIKQHSPHASKPPTQKPMARFHERNLRGQDAFLDMRFLWRFLASGAKATLTS